MGKPLGKSKLFELKEWLTVPEAARNLSTMFGEDVGEADVLQLALDGRLKLSVLFLNDTNAVKIGRLVSFEDWSLFVKTNTSWDSITIYLRKDGEFAFQSKWFAPVDIDSNTTVSSDKLLFLLDEDEVDLLKSAYLDEYSVEQQNEILQKVIETVLRLAKKQSENTMGWMLLNEYRSKDESINGIWDLPMIGAEKRFIERECHRLINGPEGIKDWDDINIGFIHVENRNKEVWHLREIFEDNTVSDSGFKLSLRSLSRIENILNRSGIKGDFFEEVKKQKEIVTDWLSRDEIPFYGGKSYIPCPLPRSSILAVRTQYLREFQTVEGRYNERNNLYNEKIETTNMHLIGALLDIILKNKIFHSEQDLRCYISDNYNAFGLSESNLGKRFADAKRHLKAAIK